MKRFEKGKSQQKNQLQFQLSANELLFFPEQYDPKPKGAPTTDKNDLIRKMNYLKKIKKMLPGNQRHLRSERDARYLHKNAMVSGTQSLVHIDVNQEELCYDHLVDRCAKNGKINSCGRQHQLRNPRFLGACKFYMSGVCANGDLCQFMHDDYPCRYYYLDLAHPKLGNEENCRFKHGGPLSKRLYRNFKKQIEIWIKVMLKDKPEQIENFLMEYMDKLEVKHAQLEQKFGNGDNDSDSDSSTIDLARNGVKLDTILTSKQINTLLENNINTIAQINQIPIDDLIEFGLHMDQIYKITTTVCTEGSQMAVCDAPILECEQDSFTDYNLENDKDFLLGFSDNEMNEAEEMLHDKQQTLNLSNLKKTDEMSTNQTGNELKTHNGEIVVCMQNQYQNTISDMDENDEFRLIINEDI